MIQQHHYQARPSNGESASDETSIDIPIYSRTPPLQACSVTPPGPLSPTPPLHMSHHSHHTDGLFHIELNFIIVLVAHFRTPNCYVK